jgi:2C-methyl-D-erythritol 2,4-cyclodiphosphate synthase
VLNITTKTLNIFWGEIGDLEKCKKKGKQIAKSEKIRTFLKNVLNITTKTLNITKKTNIFLGKTGDFENLFYLKEYFLMFF